MAYAALSRRINRTIAAFDAIADYLAYISGRKSLIWVSSTFPTMFGYGGMALAPVSMDSASFATEIESASRALNRVNMSVYPVDAGGIQIDSGRSGGLAPAVSLSNPFFGRAATRDTMNTLAQQTGGRAFYGTNGLAGAIKNPVDSTSLGVRVTVKTLEPAASRSLRVYLHLDSQELLLEKDADRTRNGGVDLLFYQLGPGDAPVAAWKQRTDFHLTPAEYDALVKSGILLGSRQAIAPDAHTLRIFVRDSSGALGSVTIPLTSFLHSSKN